MFHELRENCLANIHPSLSAMMPKHPDRCRELFLARKSSNGKILKTGLTHYISNPWREFTIRLPDSSDVAADIACYSYDPGHVRVSGMYLSCKPPFPIEFLEAGGL